MGILDVFKKKKKREAGKEEKKAKIKKEELPSEEIKLSPAAKKIRKKDFSQAFRILKEVHVTEKATKLGGENKYVFKIFPKANKTEVKKAVQDLYGAAVRDVNIINIHRKTKRVAGRRKGGYKRGYKKAIVTLYEGQKIELIPR